MVSEALTLLSAVVLTVTVACGVVFSKRIGYANTLLHPFFWYTVYYVLYAPLRGLMIGAGLVEPYFREQVNIDEYMAAILFGFLFYVAVACVCFAGTPRAQYRRRPLGDSEHGRRRLDCPVRLGSIGLILRPLLWICGILVVTGAAIGFQTGMFNIFDVALYDQAFTITKSIASNCVGMNMFLFGLSLVAIRSKAAPRLGRAGLVLVLAFLLFKGIASGSRGNIMVAIVLVAIAGFYLKAHARAFKIAAALLVPALFLSVLLTYMRDDSGVNVYREVKIANYSEVRIAAASARGDDVGIGRSVTALLQRTTYYLDAWALMLHRDVAGISNDSGGKGLFQCGSMGDLLQFVPALVWPARPKDIFNSWMGRVLVDNFDSGVTVPVGGEGEGLYVLGWAGVMFGLAKGLVIVGSWRLFTRASYTGHVYYIVWLVYYYVIGDGTMFGSTIDYVKHAMWFSLIFVALYLFIRNRHEQRRQIELNRRGIA